LSDEPCRPFSANRKGLNLGEASAAVVYAKGDGEGWRMLGGGVRNDANHISGPSRTGEGSYLALRSVLKGLNSNDIAFVNAHGTATLYNDEMESIAIDRAGLADIPLFSLKGIYGHTMGAAGVLETILSMQAVEHGVVFGTHGYHGLGVSRQVNISADNRTTDKLSFVKLLSGFGGCNAAMKFCYADSSTQRPNNSETQRPNDSQTQRLLPSIRLTPTTDELVDLYRAHIADYPKFFKMDPLSRLGFVATELLLKESPKADYGVLLFNRSSSLADDSAFQATIQNRDNWFPSPALFVYTLPNIVTGEIAIRNHFQTETNFIVLDAPHADIMAAQIAIAAEHGPQIAGWCDVDANGNYLAAIVAVPQHTPKETIEQKLNEILK
jgi:3-oxoacyl-[acyl-carrier-protein] synthase-1